METTYINAEKVICAEGKFYSFESEADVIHLEWAKKTLAEPDRIYPNGRHSHECATEQLEDAEISLLGEEIFLCN